jgi:hypothetical protein
MCRIGTCSKQHPPPPRNNPHPPPPALPRRGMFFRPARDPGTDRRIVPAPVGPLPGPDRWWRRVHGLKAVATIVQALPGLHPCQGVRPRPSTATSTPRQGRHNPSPAFQRGEPAPTPLRPGHGSHNRPSSPVHGPKAVATIVQALPGLHPCQGVRPRPSTATSTPRQGRHNPSPAFHRGEPAPTPLRPGHGSHNRPSSPVHGPKAVATIVQAGQRRLRHRISRAFLCSTVDAVLTHARDGDSRRGPCPSGGGRGG